MSCQVRENDGKTCGLLGSAAGVYLPEGRHPIIAFFQYSIIPVMSEAN
jgi:hypothetical protein